MMRRCCRCGACSFFEFDTRVLCDLNLHLNCRFWIVNYRYLRQTRLFCILHFEQNMMHKYVTAADVMRKCNLTYEDLSRMASSNEVRSFKAGPCRRKYNFEDIRTALGDNYKKIQREGQRICYARVSSPDQEEDLQKQIRYLMGKYPNHEIIRDVGSGLNLKRKGLVDLLDRICDGKVSEVVIVYRDRLCRIGYELIEFLCKKCDTKLIVENESDDSCQNDQQELLQDLMAVAAAFVNKNNNLLKRKQKRKRDSESQNTGTVVVHDDGNIPDESSRELVIDDPNDQ